ncbi:hypothetical protein D3C81_1986890 [compost metagenome]
MVLQAQDHLPAEGELISEGVISRSSVGCEFGGSCSSQAAGAGIGGHCGTAAGCFDEQPLSANVNSTAQLLVGIERIGQFLGVFEVVGGSRGQALAGDTGGFA